MSQDQNRTYVPVHTITVPGRISDSRLVIAGRLPGLNEYTTACRTSPHKGNEMKRQATDTVMWHILSQIRGVKFTRPVFIIFTFYEPNKRRDHDNVSSFARKAIQDALVKCGTLKDDGWGYVTGHMDFFEVDKDNPRIVVEFVEQGGVAKCKEQPAKSSKK